MLLTMSFCSQPLSPVNLVTRPSSGPSTSLPVPLGVDGLQVFILIPLVSLSFAGTTSGSLRASSTIYLHTYDTKISFSSAPLGTSH